MEFKVIIDDSMLGLGIGGEGAGVLEKKLISLVNDFEDGDWRYQKFSNFIWDNIADTALSVRERDALKSKPRSMLIEAAKNLRLTDSTSDAGRGGELAEIVLYGLMKKKFNAIPVVPKIFYKQNSRDYAKGSDSVHIVIEESGRFTLWFGEAKFYSDINDARIPGIVQSVGNSLRTDKLKKENSIITSLGDLDIINIDDKTRNEIRKALANSSSIDGIKEVINVPILLLHECNHTARAREETPQYLDAVREFHMERATSYFKRQASDLSHIFKYTSITFHLILFPVPKKAPVIDGFMREVAHYRAT